MKLESQVVALITGSTTRHGRAIARQFAAEGSSVVINPTAAFTTESFGTVEILVDRRVGLASAEGRRR